VRHSWTSLHWAELGWAGSLGCPPQQPTGLSRLSCLCPIICDPPAAPALLAAARQRDEQGREYIDRDLMAAGPSQVCGRAAACMRGLADWGAVATPRYAFFSYMPVRCTAACMTACTLMPSAVPLQAARLLNERSCNSPNGSPRPPRSPRLKPPPHVRVPPQRVACPGGMQISSAR
jgi:hypothetical protein